MIKNILTDGMPDTIVVDGVPFEIYTDYRTWIKVGYKLKELSAAKDQSEEQYQKFVELCDLCIKDYPKGYLLADDIINSILNFYAGFPKAENEKAEKSREKDKQNPKPQSFDFVFDAPYIYCSFLSFYHIDLYDVEYMHWWKFLTLFEGLMMSEQTSVNFIVGARQQTVKSTMPKEEKARIQKLKAQFALPEDEITKSAKNKLTSILGSVPKKQNPDKTAE